MRRFPALETLFSGPAGLLNLAWPVAAIVVGHHLFGLAEQLSSSDLDAESPVLHELGDDLAWATSSVDKVFHLDQDSSRSLDRLRTHLKGCDLTAGEVLHARVHLRLGDESDIQALADDTVGSQEGCVAQVLRSLPPPPQLVGHSGVAFVARLSTGESSLIDPEPWSPLQCRSWTWREGEPDELDAAVAWDLWRSWAPQLSCPSTAEAATVDLTLGQAALQALSWPETRCLQDRATSLMGEFRDQVRPHFDPTHEQIHCSLIVLLSSEMH